MTPPAGDRLQPSAVRRGSMCDRGSLWLTAAEGDWYRRPAPLAPAERGIVVPAASGRTGDKVMRILSVDTNRGNPHDVRGSNSGNNQQAT